MKLLSNPGSGSVYSVPNLQTRSGMHPVPYSIGIGVLFRVKSVGDEFGHSLRLEPMLRMSGAMLPFSLHTFMVCTE
jgi:hypothetical protein